MAEEKSPEDAARSGNPQVAAEGRAAKTKKTRSRAAKKKNSLATTRSWVVPTFLALLLLGVAWLVVWYLTTSTGNRVPFMTDLGNWNMLIAMVLSVVFATNAAMAGNRDVIEVLHFCGAEDRFIAGEFQRHFLMLGMKGGAIGGGLDFVAIAVLSYLMHGAAGRPGADQYEALFGVFSIGWTAYGWLVALVVAVAVLTATTSRFAVRRSLAAIT